jgi:N-acetylneuraminic acid mutarotase
MDGSVRRSPLLDRQVVVYVFILLAIAGSVIYAARSVLFRPWTARRFISAATIENRVYVFGGIDKQNLPLRDILCIDLEERTIKRVAEFPTERYAVSSAVAGGKIYLAGGYDTKGYYDDIFIFDPDSREIEKIGTLPEPRGFGAMVAYDRKLYYLFGWNGGGIGETVFEIDPAAGEAREFENGIPPVQYHTALASGEELYVYGGEDSENRYLDEVYRINMKNWDIEERWKLPFGIARSPAAILDGKLYIAGGWSGGSIKTVMRIDTRDPTPEVEEIGKIPHETGSFALSSFQGDLYLIGGTEERFKRQIRILRIHPGTLETESQVFKSYVWW